ncbi:PH domain-containing protein [Mesonia sp. MT50]|uniref:PH domain-containing protein n=1 Tax=Mesonia profundi TaxID=3070998 RepID=A0ABU1A494_9FLAO|nr:PH domain-containing protein [Mesonia profundi]MDQ7918530.1 PH domain-containing protein [Mesonia profundi]
MNKPFSQPQRQSMVGIVLIFLSALYKSLKGLWAIAIYVFLGKTSSFNYTYISLGLIAFAILILIFSILSYRKFLFHINYEADEFILNKGVFSSENIAISFDKIQQVYFKRSIIQRIIGVYNVVIQSAGSSEKEIEIKALSEEKAMLLQQKLNSFIEEESKAEEEELSTESFPEEKKKTVYWEHRLTFTDLLKLGVTSNYFRGFGLILIFFSSLYNQFADLFTENEYADEAANYLNTFQSVGEILMVLTFMFITVFLVGIVVSIIETFLKYFELKLTQSKDSLELEMGLKTNTKVSLHPNRVQILRLITNPIQRKLNMYQLQLSLTSSTETQKKNRINIPGLSWDKATKASRFLHHHEREEGEVYKPHKLWFYRRLFWGIVPVLAAALGLNYIFETLPNPVVLGLALVYAICIFLYQHKVYQKINLEISEEFLVKSTGLWSKMQVIIETFKLQSISVSQPIWLRRRKLVNITFHTASGDVRFPLVNEAFVTQVNYLLYKIETSTKAWM